MWQWLDCQPWIDQGFSIGLCGVWSTDIGSWHMKSLLIKRALLNFFNFQTVLLHHCWGLGAWNMGPPGPQILLRCNSTGFPMVPKDLQCFGLTLQVNLNGRDMTDLTQKNTFYNFHLQHLKESIPIYNILLRFLVQEDYPPSQLTFDKWKKTLVVSPSLEPGAEVRDRAWDLTILALSAVLGSRRYYQWLPGLWNKNLCKLLGGKDVKKLKHLVMSCHVKSKVLQLKKALNDGWNVWFKFQHDSL